MARPVIPSLVASEIRSALVDYLATTFSLCDDDVSDAGDDAVTSPLVECDDTISAIKRYMNAYGPVMSDAMRLVR